jgi:hypothetical protein
MATWEGIPFTWGGISGKKQSGEESLKDRTYWEESPGKSKTGEEYRGGHTYEIEFPYPTS